jgi:hypothetical protein
MYSRSSDTSVKAMFCVYRNLRAGYRQAKVDITARFLYNGSINRNGERYEAL